uniref:Uncharacterized protein n=1 Tax=Clytia hemisphaerica TaxID=252671 RepID=A0A7M5V7C1_9CNID
KQKSFPLTQIARDLNFSTSRSGVYRKRVFIRMILKTVLVVLCYYACCDASLYDYQEDHYGSYYKKDDISEIPQLGDANPLVNLKGEATRHDYFYDDLINAKGCPTPVFKIQMERERVIISDPIANKAMYDRRTIRVEHQLNTMTSSALDIRLPIWIM